MPEPSHAAVTQQDIEAASDEAWELASTIVLGNQGVGNAAVLIDRFRRQVEQAALSAPVETSGYAEVVEPDVNAVARAIYKADTLNQNADTRPPLDLSVVDLDKWYDENAAMPLSGPGFVRRYEALALAALQVKP